MRILAFMAHPDDVEINCAGTMLRLQETAECELAIATMTSGDCGSISQRPEEIARIRHGEAVAAAESLGAEYYCAGQPDVLIFYDRPTLLRTVEIVRKAAPDIVITHPPVDYMIDHEETSRLVRTACFATGMPNFLTGDVEPAMPAKTPYLYYALPMEGKDIYGRPVEPSLIVDVTDLMERKIEALACHASQREWLRAHHGMDEYIEAMKRQSAAYGRLTDRPYAEVFRQHLGHGYPQDDIISRLLRGHT